MGRNTRLPTQPPSDTPTMALQVDNNFGDDSSLTAPNDCCCCNVRSGHSSQGKTLYDGSKIQRHSLLCSMVQANSCPCCSLAQNSERMGITSPLLKRTAIMCMTVTCIVLIVVGNILTGVASGVCRAERPSSNPAAPIDPKCSMFGMHIAGDVLLRLFEAILIFYYIYVLTSQRIQMQHDLGLDGEQLKCCTKGCCLEFLCACCCHTFAMAEVNILYKGYITAGCCGAAEEDQTKTETSA